MILTTLLNCTIRNGATRRPAGKELRRLGETRAGCSSSKVRMILERIADALRDTAKPLAAYAKEHPAFAETGGRMLQEWEIGIARALAAT